MRNQSWRQTLPSWLLVYWLSQQLPNVQAVLPTAAIDVLSGASGVPYTLLASQASFGSYPAMQAKNNKRQSLQLPPTENSLLCNDVTSKASSEGTGIMLVPRGVCTFEKKARNAQLLGASGIIVYGTLASRYSLNSTKYINHTEPFDYTVDDIIYPAKFVDYDCDKGRAEIPASSVEMKPLPYNAQHNDPILSGNTDSNLCRANSPNHLETCPSQACLLTGETVGNDKVEACCAWDLLVWLYADPTFDTDAVTIPAVYVTMEQGHQLLQDVSSSSSPPQVVLYTRYRPSYNISAILIWALGVFVAAVAAYLSASDYRRAKNQVMQHHSDSSRHDRGETAVPRGGDDVVESATRSRSRSPPSSEVEVEDPLSSPAAPAATSTQPLFTTQESQESLELGAGHAFGFIIMASSGLFILFFFKIYNVVKVMYAFGCAGAVTQVLMYPMVSALFRCLNIVDFTTLHTKFLDIGRVSFYEMVALVFGYGLGLAWLVVAFAVRHPENNTFFWITQDVMGACMCIMFLSLIKLNSIRVASILLVVAFVYDIFFVFITPLIFKGESIMITVATSGGPPKADPSWCEKYPDDSNCQGGDPLPMLLTVPRIGDYQGGASLLGLGDIVLPGLLLSFAARLDTAKDFVGLVGGGNGVLRSYTCPEQKCCGGLCTGGYFVPLVVAYAIGLFMANAAVYLMNMGQPALLYLVPCCLGTVVFMGWRRNELDGLWHGPKVISAADKMVYGEEDSDAAEGGHTPLPTEEDGVEATPVPSASDTDGEVPLLSKA